MAALNHLKCALIGFVMLLIMSGPALARNLASETKPEEEPKVHHVRELVITTLYDSNDDSIDKTAVSMSRKPEAYITTKAESNLKCYADYTSCNNSDDCCSKDCEFTCIQYGLAPVCGMMCLGPY